MSRLNVQQKWRPSLALLTGLFCIILVTVPIAGTIAARLTHNQFVRETEASLWAQAALYASAYAQTFAQQEPEPEFGHALNETQIAALNQRWQPIEPRLQLRYDPVLSARPAAEPIGTPASGLYLALTPALSKLARNAQRRTLAGYRALDLDGRVIAGSGEIGTSLGHVEEIISALRGDPVSVVRARDDSAQRHFISSLSRDATYRVFVALPVVVNNRVIGAVYLARTPVDLGKFVLRERAGLFWVGIAILATMVLVGLIFWRTIYRPITALEQQISDVAEGRRDTLEPVNHYGLRETAALGQSLLSMSRALQRQSDTVTTYTAHVTHELKTPTTAIIAAAELLDGEELSARGKRLAENIGADGRRMQNLLDQLRDLASARVRASDQVSTPLGPALRRLRARFADLEISDGGNPFDVALTEKQIDMVLDHLAQNAREHGATGLNIQFDSTLRAVAITDNGSGISRANLVRATEPFFTTRRENGGTGMGLAIVDATLAAADGRLEISASDQGAKVRLTF